MNAMLPQDCAIKQILTVMMEINAAMMDVIPQLETALTLQSHAMMEMLALMTIAIQLWDANTLTSTFLLNAMTTVFARLILVITVLDVFTLTSLATTDLIAPLTLATR